MVSAGGRKDGEREAEDRGAEEERREESEIEGISN